LSEVATPGRECPPGQEDAPDETGPPNGLRNQHPLDEIVISQLNNL